jgi:hypothetical protein
MRGLLLLAGVHCGLMACCCLPGNITPNKPKPQLPKRTDAERKQVEREYEELVERGYVAGIGQTGPVPRAFMRQPFFDASFEEKTRIATACYLRVYALPKGVTADEFDELLFIHDAQTKEYVGSFNLSRQLVLE